MADYTNMSTEDLSAAFASARQGLDTLLALTEVTPEQVEEAETFAAQVRDIEAEQARRAEVAAAAANRFASLRTEFSLEDEEEQPSEEEADEADEETDEAEEASR